MSVGVSGAQGLSRDEQEVSSRKQRIVPFWNSSDASSAMARLRGPRAFALLNCVKIAHLEVVDIEKAINQL
jgi:hypothetical protein